MHLNDSARTTDKSLEQLRRHLNAVHLIQDPNHSKTFQFPSQVCDGSIQRWRLRPGLDLIIHNLDFREKAVIERDRSDSKTQLGLSFCLAGQIRGVWPTSEEAVQLQTGQVSLGVVNATSSRVEYAASQHVSLVHIHIQPDAIGLLSQEVVEQLPNPLRDVIIGRDQPSYFQSHPMTPVMTATVRQLLRCPYRGLSQRLYIESKTLELISHYFDPLLSSDSSRHQASDLQADEIDRILYARDILLSQVTNPPTLLELAHQIGLNDRKLKQGFRKVFGTTVFSYLHNHRMQEAQKLLLMPGATIASVAQVVGYSNPEAFSVAFRRTFAISPKAYQMQRR